MTLTYHNALSIAEIVVYVPCLAVAILLCIRHGFGRSSGWFFLIIFTLARIIGSIMQLLTINDPSSVSLYTGVVILQNIGLSPLMLATVGLLSRLLENIRKAHSTFLTPHMLRLIQLLIIVSLILGIVGGINASANISKGVYQPGSLNKVGAALFIVSYIAIVATVILLSFSVSHAEHGEKRILLAVAISLPFLLVRLVYACMVTFSHIHAFNSLQGSVTLLLCLALIQEFIVLIIYEIMGVTLQQISKDPQPSTAEHYPVNSMSSSEYPGQSQGRVIGTMRKIGRRTIIGRLVTVAMDKQQSRGDVEMGSRN